MRYLIILTLCLAYLSGNAQTQTTNEHPSQTIRGQVMDADSKMPLIGATVILQGSDPLVGTVTDIDGLFRLENIPVGRWTLEFSFIGYEPSINSGIVVTSGKETVLAVDLQESTLKLDAVTIKAEEDKTRALNEMASVSAIAFSVDETQRYAAAVFDPARMAQSFAGVTGASDFFNNELIIRGNSPCGMLWRLEGIEIPNPNHFGDMGSTGGAISMLSSSTLGRSDFYTGAFPAEIGNATSGVMDLSFRNGNSEQREHSFMIGLMGVEGSSEGYFSNDSRASYLINYRYSTLALLNTFWPVIGDILPAYQDLSFKVNVPTENAGTFSLFGLGGANIATLDADADSTLWEGEEDDEGFIAKQQVGVIGLTHKLLLSDKAYLKSTVAYTTDRYQDELYYLRPENNYEQYYYDKTDFVNNSYRANITLTNKLSSRHTIRSGIIASQLEFNYDYQNRDNDEDAWITYINGSGDATYAQAFAQWKFRIDDAWTLSTGVHYSHLFLNDKYSIEPRASIEWEYQEGKRLSFATGLHSRMEHPTAYYIQPGEVGQSVGLNTDLELPKSAQAVLGWSSPLGPSTHIKVEAYGQYLYDQAVEADPNSREAIMNAAGVWDLIGADSVISEGEGYNYGIELTLERFFSRGYYYMITGSLFDSKFRPQDQQWWNTRFNRNYAGNILGGKEFKVGKKKQNVIGLNGRFVYSGGNRYRAIDLPASIAASETVYAQDRFTDQAKMFYRFDLGFKYQFNRPKSTHSILFDFQNVTNRLNTYSLYFDSGTNQLETDDQLGAFPFFNYRIEFF